MLLGQGEDHHLVVGQQVPLDRPRERQSVELRPIGRRIVHREHFRLVAGCLRLGPFRIETRRGSHVEALYGPDPFRVVDQHERRGLVSGAFDARGPVRLVAEDEVERRRAAVLRLLDETERVVGAENHGHGIGRGGPQRAADRGRIRGHRNLQLL